MALNTTPGDDCESLCSVADADDYHTKRGNVSAWMPLDTSRKEALLRQAYARLYGDYWRCWPAGETFGTVAGIVMRGARDACAQLALYAVDGPLDGELSPQVLEQDVGPIKTKFSEAKDGGRRHFPDVARMMAPYFAPLNLYSLPLVRA